MNKQRFLILFALTLTAVISLFLLVTFTNLPNSKKNGFTRNLLTKNVTLLHQSNFEIPYIQLCGVSSDNIFLSVPNPQWLIMMKKSLKKQTQYRIPVEKREELSLHSFYVDSPNVYLFANNIPALIYGSLSGKEVRTLKLSTSQFTRSVYLSPTSIILRAFDSTFQHPEFQKINIQTGKIETKNALIESQGDYGLASDGFMQYDSLTHRILFVEYYTNKFLCIDTNLNLLYASRTIDTISYNPVAIKDIKFDTASRLMPITPRVTVNNDGSASNGVLFVNSELKADNDSSSHYLNNSVIDRYDIKGGKYIGSFYIPNLNHEKLNSFLVQNDLLIALYKSQIATFQLKF